jgi:hypothetical protein
MCPRLRYTPFSSSVQLQPSKVCDILQAPLPNAPENCIAGPYFEVILKDMAMWKSDVSEMLCNVCG